jgi:DNA-binding NarL/FixJ family response regulator
MAPISLLLVDDSASFLSIVTRFLQEHNHGEVVVVGTAHGGREALAQARDLRPQVILIDLSMPDLPGLEAIPRLRAMLPEVGIIALTLWHANGYREAALAAGADDLVSKFAVNSDLLPAIRRVARSKGSQEKPVAKAEWVPQ